MQTKTPESPVLTLGVAARRLGLELWQVQSLYRRSLLPQPARVGPFRVVREADLPAIRAVALAEGYLRPKKVPA